VEIEALLRLCEEHNIFLVVDEAYREFVFDGLLPVSILNIAPNNKRVIVIDSLSKRYSLCGARLGCLLTPNEEVLATTLNIAQARLAAPTIEQFAAAYMLRHIGDDYVTGVRDEYQGRRDVLYAEFSKIPQVMVHKSRGALYTVARLPVEDAEAFAMYMLSEFRKDGCTVFVAPASGFYMQNAKGRQKIRVAYVLEKEQIKHSVSIIKDALDAYPGAKG
jgi:aspartate aminotransferase